MHLPAGGGREVPPPLRGSVSRGRIVASPADRLRRHGHPAPDEVDSPLPGERPASNPSIPSHESFDPGVAALDREGGDQSPDGLGTSIAGRPGGGPRRRTPTTTRESDQQGCDSDRKEHPWPVRCKICCTDAHILLHDSIIEATVGCGSARRRTWRHKDHRVRGTGWFPRRATGSSGWGGLGGRDEAVRFCLGVWSTR